jgi:hypothetical protein
MVVEGPKFVMGVKTQDTITSKKEYIPGPG